MNITGFLWACLMGFCVSLAFHQTWAHETEVAQAGAVVSKKVPGRVTSVWITPLFLPLLFLVIALLGPFYGTALMAAILEETILEFLVLLIFYDAILMALLPLLRRIFSARACATLWLIPVFLYWMANLRREHQPMPLLVLRIPRNVLTILAWIWLAGMAAVVLWKIFTHFRFRREVLDHASPIRGLEILNLWEREQALIERKKPIPLFYSDRVLSPMTIGLFQLTTVLPRKSYTTEELTLIFRHELRHVQRQDVATKVFYAFCEAFCWFNPLTWMATRRATADLELSCDEMVLYSADDKTRKIYANLLLHTAGDDRGFSTCLSASAQSLRYRLKRVMEGGRRFAGTVFLGIVTVSAALSCGLVTVTADFGTLNEALFDHLGTVTIDSISATETPGSSSVEVFGWDQAALLDYLGTLSVTDLGDHEPADQPEQQLFLTFQTDLGGMFFNLQETGLHVYRPIGKGSHLSQLYRLDSPVDWDAIWACLDFDAEDPNPTPIWPDMMVWFDDLNEDGPISPHRQLVRRTSGDQVFEPDQDPVSWGGIHGFHAETAKIEFNYPPDNYTIQVAGLNGEEVYTVTEKDLKDGILELAPYDAQYTTSAAFTSYSTVYEMKFYFEVVLPE